MGKWGQPQSWTVRGTFILCCSLLISSCAQQSIPTSSIAAAAAPTTGCDIFLSNNVAACEQLALNRQDGTIGLALANFHARGSSAVSFEWRKRAADFGNAKAQREIFEAYYFGRGTPENKQLADEALGKAARSGAEWANLLKATQLWKTQPRVAHEMLVDIAKRGNFHAQAFLAMGYFDGSLGEQNWTKSYFWSLVARTSFISRRSEIHFLTSPPAISREDNALSRLTYGDRCLSVDRIAPKSALDKTLQPELINLASLAATDWRTGANEPDLAAPPARIVAEPPQPAKERPPRDGDLGQRPPRQDSPKPTLNTGQLPWAPVRFASLENSATVAATATELFSRASSFVWVVTATKDNSRTSFQGSAVAISEHQLLTNCHVVSQTPVIKIRRGEATYVARVASSSTASDRCVLSVTEALPAFARSTRTFESLAVGEQVYSIGAPQGLENTLGAGLISGLRRMGAWHYVQTTAPISPGSSAAVYLTRLEIWSASRRSDCVNLRV